ncbi:2'-5' RNA ligase family protein [Clostridium rectalis]|uniref:2'-5' RNA ligase family protein n=1 Tax=Clostridium rectalis TaxID=2040295 RepID=UPI000F62F4AF|nr:2'-5' RNA ligase family protein [Clostridium rectalis]
MDRYVIVCLLKGEILKFHNSLVEDICLNFKVKRQKLPAHFTIKAPFETDKINQIELILEKFMLDKYKEKILVNGFNHFRSDVVFMKVSLCDKALDIHDSFIKELKKISWLTWKNHEGESNNKIFHCTLVSGLKDNKFYPIWEYVNNYTANFHSYFDNISILKWEDRKWVTYKQFYFK